MTTKNETKNNKNVDIYTTNSSGVVKRSVSFTPDSGVVVGSAGKGSLGTSSDNIKLHRGSSCLQFVKETDTTSDGTSAPYSNLANVPLIYSGEFIVGSVSQVTAGRATHSSLSTAISVANTGDTIHILELDSLITEDSTITLSKRLNILGNGFGSEISDNFVMTPSASKSLLKNVYFSKNITFESNCNNLIIQDCWKSPTSVLTNNETNNLITICGNADPVTGYFHFNAVDGGKFSHVNNSVKVQYDGKILVGGNFQNYGGTSGRNYLIRLNSDGTLDTSFCSNSSDSLKFDSVINSIVVQSNGKILVGGSFSNYGGTSGRNYLIRLNSEGTLDTSFCNNAVDGEKFDSAIRSIAVQYDGKILVGGDFLGYSGEIGRMHLVRLNSDGTLDTAFCVNAVDGSKFGPILTISIQINGSIIIGGSFTNYSSTIGRDRLVRLNSDGTLDTAFCVNAVDSVKFNNSVKVIKVQADSKILVGGSFVNYAGTTNRDRFIRLNADGTIDTSFCINAVDDKKFRVYGYPSGICSVLNIEVQNSGKILVGGDFSAYNNTFNRDSLIRLNSDGTLDTAFCINSSDGGKFSFSFGSSVLSTVTQSDGKILVGGNYINYGSTSGRNYLIRLNDDGTLELEAPLPIVTALTFNTNAVDSSKFNNYVYTTSIQADDKALVGGFFTNYGVSGRNKLLRLNYDGTLDTIFCSNASDGSKFGDALYTISIHSDGKIIVGGGFGNYGIAGRSRLVRLNSDGTLDVAFCVNASNGNKFSDLVYTSEIQQDGKILVGGSFTNYASLNRNRLVRLNNDGTLDSDFCSNAVDGAKFSSEILDIVVQQDGKILVGGYFTSYGVSGRNRLVRLNSDGTLDVAFCSNASDGSKFGGNVLALSTQPDGKILVGGIFSNYAGTSTRNNLIRLNSDGTLDTSFCVNASDGSKFNSNIYSIVIQPDGKILVGGFFTDYAGISGRNKLVRLNSDGTTDTSFCVNASDSNKVNYFIYKISQRYDGKILIGGSFTNYGGTSGRNYLTLLNNDGTIVSETPNNIPSALTFSTNASDSNKFNNVINSMKTMSDGKLLVGGNYSDYASTIGRNRLVMLNTDGTPDTIFCSNSVDNGKFNGRVYAVETLFDVKILVGGFFTNYAGTSNRSRLVLLNKDGTLDTTFCTNAVDGGKFNGYVTSLAVQPDGKILVGGDFTNYATTTQRDRFIRLNYNGTLDTAFCVNSSDGNTFNANVRTICVQTDGKILVGGDFTNSGSPVITGTNYLVRLNSDGTFDLTFCSNAVRTGSVGKFSSNVRSIKVQLDGKILVGGQFRDYAGTSGRSCLIRLNSDGTLDTDFCINSSDGNKFSHSVLHSMTAVNNITIQSDGKILIGGFFDNYDTVNSYLIRLNLDGTLNTTFCNNASSGKITGEVYTTDLQIDSKIFFSGNFQNYAGTSTRNRLVEINADGTLT